jgi:hypothetical protein
MMVVLGPKVQIPSDHIPGQGETCVLAGSDPAFGE